MKDRFRADKSPMPKQEARIGFTDFKAHLERIGVFVPVEHARELYVGLVYFEEFAATVESATSQMEFLTISQRR